MIVTTVKELTKYKEIPYAKEMADFIESFKKTEMNTGKYEIYGEDLFASVGAYETESAEDRKFENHKKYIDLQILVKGTEEIHWAPVETLEMTEESFSQGGDIAFYNGNESGVVILDGDVCAVLFENDAHKPNVMHKDKENVIKIVFKIKKPE